MSEEIPDDIQQLISAAKLDVQYHCIKCGVTLIAFGRELSPERKWSCLDCKVPGTTHAKAETQ